MHHAFWILPELLILRAQKHQHACVFIPAMCVDVSWMSPFLAPRLSYLLRMQMQLLQLLSRLQDSRYAVDWTIANICRPLERDILHVVHIVGRQTPNVVGPDHSTAYMKFQNTPMNPMQEVKAERVRCELGHAC